MNIKLPENIKDNDFLGRAVFSSKQGTEKRIKPNVFMEKEPSNSLSMDRFGFCPKKELIDIQDQNAKIRSTKAKDNQRSFYGWAKIKAVDARRKERKVKSNPVQGNPYHAEVILPIHTRDEQKAHAVNLATLSDWYPNPKITKGGRL